MSAESSFRGFPSDTIPFFMQLSQNNNRAWFDTHRPLYEKAVLDPSKALVEALGRRLETIAPAIHADPRVNQSLFRINRDVRFSKDKSPYKTYFALLFWEGQGPKLECSSFYFHVEPPNMLLGAGIYIFPDHILQAYRQAVIDPEQGTALASAVQAVQEAGFGIDGKRYKRVPRDYPADHERAELLLYNGLTAGHTSVIPEVFYTPELVDYCFENFRALLPVHHWLVRLTAGMSEVEAQ
jgi:uncharacterized protein (TIGR02453 family)